MRKMFFVLLILSLATTTACGGWLGYMRANPPANRVVTQQQGVPGAGITDPHAPEGELPPENGIPSGSITDAGPKPPEKPPERKPCGDVASNRYCFFECPEWKEMAALNVVINGYLLETGIDIFRVRDGMGDPLAVIVVSATAGQKMYLVTTKSGNVPNDLGKFDGKITMPHAALPGQTPILIEWQKLIPTLAFENEVKGVIAIVRPNYVQAGFKIK